MTPQTTSMTGPVKGVKYRRGAPPTRQWKFQADGIRAYDRYERTSALGTPSALHVREGGRSRPLRLVAGQHVEFLDMDLVYHRDGAQYILDRLKPAFKQKEVYVKRRHSYENISRFHQEPLRTLQSLPATRSSPEIHRGGCEPDLRHRGSRLLDV